MWVRVPSASAAVRSALTRYSVSAIGFRGFGPSMRTAQNRAWVPSSRSCSDENGGGAVGRVGE